MIWGEIQKIYLGLALTETQHNPKWSLLFPCLITSLLQNQGYVIPEDEPHPLRLLDMFGEYRWNNSVSKMDDSRKGKLATAPVPVPTAAPLPTREWHVELDLLKRDLNDFRAQYERDTVRTHSLLQDILARLPPIPDTMASHP